MIIFGMTKDEEIELKKLELKEEHSNSEEERFKILVSGLERIQSV
mgnify:FL=1